MRFEIRMRPAQRLHDAVDDCVEVSLSKFASLRRGSRTTRGCRRSRALETRPQHRHAEAAAAVWCASRRHHVLWSVGSPVSAGSRDVIENFLMQAARRSRRGRSTRTPRASVARRLNRERRVRRVAVWDAVRTCADDHANMSACRRIAAERTGGVIEPGAEAELIVAAAASSGDRQITRVARPRSPRWLMARRVGRAVQQGG